MSCYIFNHRLKKCFQYANEDLHDDSGLKNIEKIKKVGLKQPNFFRDYCVIQVPSTLFFIEKI